MRRIFAMLLCVCICMTMPLCALAEETTTEPTTEPAQPDDNEYEDGVLGWLEGIFDGFSSLPSRIWEFLKAGFDSVVSAIESLSFPDITALFDGFDFTPVTDFFTNAWSEITSGFGLRDFIIENFGWLSDTAPSDDAESGDDWVAGLRSFWRTMGHITDALPEEVTLTLTFVFCGLLIIAILKVF